MLFDVLFSDGADRLTVQQSIQSDLHRLFNTKEGSLKHLPDYGLPDLQSIYQSFPQGVLNFIELLQKKIDKYEPRLNNILIESDNKGKERCVISLMISAEIINQGSALFEGDFYSAGHVNLSYGYNQ